MSKLTQHLQKTFEENTGVPRIYDGGHWYTGQTIMEDTAKICGYLSEARVAPGDRILLSYPNSYSFIITYLAILQYGATVAPINPNMPASELRAFVRRCQPKFGFVGAKHLEILQQEDFSDSLETLFLIDTATASLPTEQYVYDERSDHWEEHPLNPFATAVGNAEPPEEALAILLYTSGTTGNPKAVGLQHRHILATINNIIHSHQLSASDVAYCFLPLFHINAQVIAFLSTCLSGGRVVIAPKFSASKFWSTIEEQNITWVSAVPTIIAILLKATRPRVIPKQLRFIRSASAQLPMLTAKRFEQKLGIPVIESYGMTEAASQICINPLPPGKRVLGSVGLPVGLNLRIVDDQGHPLPANEVGEITIQGDNVIDAYVQADHQNDFQHGWFHTGDLGYQNEEGYVFIVGRKKEMINRGGEKVSPYEVEDTIRELPGVDQVAVIGMPDPLYGEKVCAYIVAEKSVETNGLSEKILEHCRQSLSSYKCPSLVHVVNDIPVGPTGKIQRHRLKQQELATSN
ncbi:AMP-dependent ligase [Pullulanibacillus camelliae]|uniref:AMP-dependent ligase n=1 Tax=Pullulanibacillus camelliae TaxID=1707096 RepID=A0A8J2YDC6_9BACL|nr:AMP-binding protein [Pullulanibacillus camelliae]GGE33572.1 AMP-dependent ligase [Pullulanibacillus camelliae]